ncbi:uncharacterized protein LOC120328510 [Styela clava]
MSRYSPSPDISSPSIRHPMSGTAQINRHQYGIEYTKKYRKRTMILAVSQLILGLCLILVGVLSIYFKFAGMEAWFGIVLVVFSCFGIASSCLPSKIMIIVCLTTSILGIVISVTGIGMEIPLVAFSAGYINNIIPLALHSVSMVLYIALLLLYVLSCSKYCQPMKCCKGCSCCDATEDDQEFLVQSCEETLTVDVHSTTMAERTQTGVAISHPAYNDIRSHGTILTKEKQMKTISTYQS